MTGIALQTSIQTHNFTPNWTKDAHTIWATQAQTDEDIQDEIQELKSVIKWVGDQLIDVQKQVMLKCDWNSTHFCVTPVQFNKTLRSVTCINCKLYTCLSSSVSLRNESLLILRS